MYKLVKICSSGDDDEKSKIKNQRLTNKFKNHNSDRLRAFKKFISSANVLIIRGFKYEVQHGLKIHETPDAEF